VGEQPGAGEPARDRARRRFQLHDALACRTGELRTHVLNNPKARRHVVQNFGDVLADLAHRCAAVGAGTCRHVFDARARQMLRQRPAHRRLRGRLRNGGKRYGSGRDLQLFEPEFQLLDLAIEPLRAAPELQALQLRDDELEVLDLDGALA